MQAMLLVHEPMKIKNKG